MGCGIKRSSSSLAIACIVLEHCTYQQHNSWVEAYRVLLCTRYLNRFEEINKKVRQPWARQNKVHSYRRAFFPKFPKFGNNRRIFRYVSIHGGVLSLFVKFSRTKNTKFVNIPIFGKKTGKYGRLKNCAKKTSKNWEKSSPIRMTLSLVDFDTPRCSVA